MYADVEPQKSDFIYALYEVCRLCITFVSNDTEMTLPYFVGFIIYCYLLLLLLFIIIILVFILFIFIILL